MGGTFKNFGNDNNEVKWFSAAEQSPATFETPERSNEELKDKFWDKVDKKGIQKLSLDQFLFKHTSEDNQSFSEILESTENKRRLKVEIFKQALNIKINY